MNKIKMTVLAVALSGGLFTASAQTNVPPTSVNDFAQTAGSWFTSIDYTKAWPTNEIDFAVGGLWQNNNNWANYINVQKNIGSFAFDAEMDNAGVAGTIYRVQGGIGYRLLNRGDISFHAFLNGGYDRANKTAFTEPTLVLRKLMAHGAFAEISLDYDVMFKGQQPSTPGLRIGTGFTF